MAKNLKDKGWKSMQSLLDVEMPVQNQKPKFLLLLILFLFISGLLVGWFGRAWWQAHPVVNTIEISTNSSADLHLDNSKNNNLRPNNVVESISTINSTDLSESSRIPNFTAENSLKSNLLPTNKVLTNSKNLAENLSESNDVEVATVNTEDQSNLGLTNQDQKVNMDSDYDMPLNETNSLISNEPIATKSFTLVFPLTQLYNNHKIIDSKKKVGVGLELNTDIGGVLKGNGLSYGVQANVLFSRASKFDIFFGIGYRNLPLKRDYSFRNNGTIDFNPEVQSLTRASIFYIENIQQFHINLGLQYHLNNRFSVRGSILPTYNVVSGAFLENHPLLYQSNNNSYFSLDYSLGTQVQIFPSFGMFLIYQNNLKPFTDIEPDQGNGHKHARRISMGLSYLF